MCMLLQALNTCFAAFSPPLSLLSQRSPFQKSSHHPILPFALFTFSTRETATTKLWGKGEEGDEVKAAPFFHSPSLRPRREKPFATQKRKGKLSFFFPVPPLLLSSLQQPSRAPPRLREEGEGGRTCRVVCAATRMSEGFANGLT